MTVNSCLPAFVCRGRRSGRFAASRYGRDRAYNLWADRAGIVYQRDSGGDGAWSLFVTEALPADLVLFKSTQFAGQSYRAMVIFSGFRWKMPGHWKWVLCFLCVLVLCGTSSSARTNELCFFISALAKYGRRLEELINNQYRSDAGGCVDV